VYGIRRPNHLSQAGVAEQHPSLVMINRPVRQIELRSADVATPVIDGKQKASGKVGEPGLCAECPVEARNEWSHVSQATADAGEWRRDDVPDPLVTLGWQKPGFPDCSDEVGGQRVR
jgi:hypothetical protein